MEARWPAEASAGATARPEGIGHEQQRAGSRGAADSRRAAALVAVRASQPSRFRAQLVDGLRRTLCSGADRFRGLPDRLWVVDGEQAVALCRAVLQRRIPRRGDHHRALRRHRRERQHVPGAVAFRIFYEAPLVGQGSASAVNGAMGAADATRLYRVPLDADLSGLYRRLVVEVAWGGRPGLV